MAKNNKTRFFHVLYSDKTRVFDQSERAYYPIYIIIRDKSHHKQNETNGRKRTIHHENSCSYCYLQLLIKERGKNFRGMPKKKTQFRHSSVLQCTLLKSSFLFFRFSLEMKYVGEKQFSS